MVTEKILIYNKNIYDIIDEIKLYANKRGYYYNCVESNSEYVMEIYDRKVESSSLLNMMDMFIGNYLLPERIKLTINMLINNNSIEININGNIVMNELNVINHSPNKRDKNRCEDILNNFTEYIKRIYKI